MRTIAISLLLFLNLEALAQKEGDRVVVIADKEIEVQGEDRVVAKLGRGNQFIVRTVRPKKLLVEWEYQLGWVHREDVATLDEAQAVFSKAIENDPLASDYIGRGAVFQRKREFEKAIADYDSAIKLDPSDAWTYNRRGMSWKALGETEKAIADYTRAINVNPKFATAYSNRGLVWFFVGEYQKAITDFDSAIRIDPKLSNAYSSRALLRSTCPSADFRNATQAIADAKKACELANFKSDGALASLAAAYAEKGDFDKAVETIKSAIKLQPDAFAHWLEEFEMGKPHRLSSPR